MNYQSGLKTLRAKLIEQATGAPAPQEKSLESFISSRSQNQMPEETPEDLMSKSANWMSEIKKATLEFKKAQEMVRSVRPAPNPFTAAAEGFLDQRKARKEEKKEDEKEEGFISPREQDSDRRAGAHENAIATVRNNPPSIEPVKGYGEISDRKSVV